MGRLLSFLGVALFCSYLGGAFQIPNFIAIMLIVLWLGMGAGQKFGYAVAGAILLPFAMAVPMWFLPAPNEYHRVYPGDDSMLFEVFYFNGAGEALDGLAEVHQAKVSAAEASIVADRPERAPSVHQANEAVLKKRSAEGRVRPGFDIWPSPLAWILGLLVTLGAWVVNTATAAPFRDAGPLGAE